MFLSKFYFVLLLPCSKKPSGWDCIYLLVVDKKIKETKCMACETKPNQKESRIINL